MSAHASLKGKRDPRSSTDTDTQTHTATLTLPTFFLSGPLLLQSSTKHQTPKSADAGAGKRGAVAEIFRSMFVFSRQRGGSGWDFLGG